MSHIPTHTDECYTPGLQNESQNPSNQPSSYVHPTGYPSFFGHQNQFDAILSPFPSIQSSSFGVASTGHLSQFGGQSTGHPSQFGGQSTGHLSQFGGQSTGHLSQFGGQSTGHPSQFGEPSTGHPSHFHSINLHQSDPILVNVQPEGGQLDSSAGDLVDSSSSSADLAVENEKLKRELGEMKRQLQEKNRQLQDKNRQLQDKNRQLETEKEKNRLLAANNPQQPTAGMPQKIFGARIGGQECEFHADQFLCPGKVDECVCIKFGEDMLSPGAIISQIGANADEKTKMRKEWKAYFYVQYGGQYRQLRSLMVEEKIKFADHK